MGEQTGIAWTDSTFNGWLGCQKVSPACDFCYAERGSARLGAQHGLKLWDGDRYHTSDAYWRQPFAWDRKAAKAGKRHRVFCASFSDVFEDREDLVEPRDRLMRIIEQTPNLDWLLLTKRPENMVRLSRWGMSAWPKNVWAGTTAEDQVHADRRIPHLLNVNASVHFVSYEPALGPVDFSIWLGDRHAQAIGTGGVRGGACWRDGDRLRGADLATLREARVQVVAGPHQDDPVRAATRGEAAAERLHDRSCDVREGTSHGVRTSVGVAALQRTDPSRDDREPSEWKQKRQSAGEPGARDIFGADEACGERARIQSDSEPALSWVIVGGESGPRARPFRLEWARSVVAQCAAAGVSAFVKQLGRHPVSDSDDDRRHIGDMNLPHTFEMKLVDSHGGDWNEWPEDLRIRQFPKVVA